MKKIFLAVFLAFSCVNISFADDEIPVNIKADNLKYSEAAGTITATGSVEIRLKEITILSDSLRMDTRSNVVTAEGNVLMHGPQYDSKSASLIYNVSDESTSFYGFRTTLASPSIEGYLYLSAEKLDKEPSRWVGSEGTVTTCDLAEKGEPHYLTASKKIEYYPNDRVVGWSNTFYIGRVPCLWVPYLVYDLKKKNGQNWTIGHNEVEGNFIKTYWDYPDGVIYLDQMEKKGFGHGLDYNYDLGSRGSGKIYIYLLNENGDPYLKDRVFKINHNIRLSDGDTLAFSHSSSFMYLVPSGQLDQSTYHMEFDHKKDGHTFNAFADVLDDRAGNDERMTLQLNNSQNGYNTSYNYTLDQGVLEPRFERISQQLTHSQPFFLSNSTFSLNANYSDNIQTVGTPGDELLNLNYEIDQRGSFYNLRVLENWHLNLGRNPSTPAASDQYLEKLPEVTMAINPLDLKLFSLSPTLGWGYYHEVQQVPNYGQRDFSAGRTSFSLNANRSLALILGTTLTLGYGINQYLYSPGDAMYSQTENYSLNTGWFNFFRNSANFTRGISEGNTPFFFDQLGTKYSNLQDTVTLYYLDKFNWATTGGYNYETQKYFDINTTMTLHPDRSTNLTVVTGWDIEDQKYLDLSATASYTTGKNFSDCVSILQDLNFGQLESASNQLDFEVGDEAHWQNHWHFKLDHVYNSVSQGFQLVNVMAVKDLHCWEVTYTYSDYRKEFSFTFTLKAFPGEPVGYSGAKGFYFDSFQKSLDQELSGASPSRY